MTWPLDKLAVCNNALGLCGDNLVNVVEDGSDEWTTASIAYESAITYMMEQGNWNFGNGVATLRRSGDSPDDQFTDAYPKPQNSLHLIWVRVNDAQADYKIIANQICVNSYGYVVTAGYIAQPTPDQVTPTFAKALECFVRAGIYGGLHEDAKSESDYWARGEAFLMKAKTRSAQEGSRRSFFNSRLTSSRRVRRPWPRNPPGYGGSGIPG